MEKPRRGRPPLRRAPPRQPSTKTLSIGNCRVEFPDSTVVSLAADGLHLNISETIGSISIKVANEAPPDSFTGFSFTLLHPKNMDGPEKLLLQDVLKLYNTELPAMNYAANTGKESRFLENCILSGKYCTLILRNAQLELIAAATYQILPTDTNQAELPLVAVAQAHHRKGFGAYLYKELQRRLLDVGVLSIFCWGDQESETFWAKQGFLTVAEVDGRGKPWKLPIKADVRRAMSIPGSATLMISYLSSLGIQPASPAPPVRIPIEAHLGSAGESCKKASTETPPPRLHSLPQNGGIAGNKYSPGMMITTPLAEGESKSSRAPTGTPVHVTGESVSSGKNFCASFTPLNMEGVLSSLALKADGRNASEPVSATAPMVTNTSPLTNITNTKPSLNGSTRPPKKRPFSKVNQPNLVIKTYDTLPACGTVTSVNETGGIAREQEDKEDQMKLPSELVKLSTSSQNVKAGLKRGRASQVPSSGGNNEVSEKEVEPRNVRDRGENIVSEEADLDASIGAKRGRDTEGHMKTFGRRSTRKRKAGLLFENIPAEAELIKYDTNRDTDQSMKTPTDDGIDLMINLLLPQPTKDAGEEITKDTEKSAECGPPEPTEVPAKSADTRGISNSVDHPNDSSDGGGETSLQMGAVTAARPLELSGHQITCTDSSSLPANTSNVVGQTKLPLETANANGAGQRSSKKRPVIMIMNMADENQKKLLTKYVERLEGEVTCNGCHCTHVVTGEVRRTLNFCVAISSGAWILSPDWLKCSVKQKSFADEARFILKDRRFESKYKVSLQNVIYRAQLRPNLLLEGIHIFPTPHIHPPLNTICQIVEAAGGKILNSLEEVVQLEDKFHVIAVACEEDMSEAMSAAKAGLRTFSSDWLLTCIVKQELDLTAAQFTESL